MHSLGVIQRMNAEAMAEYEGENTVSVEINRENFTEAIRAAVKERGEDFVYEAPTLDGTCVYQDQNGNPSCIVGVALSKLGVILDPEWDTGEVVGGLVAEVVLSNIGVTDSGLRFAAGTAQSEQDRGANWGEALKAFEVNLKGSL